MEYSEEQERLIDPDDPDGGWVDTHHVDPTDVLDDNVSDMTFENVEEVIINL